MRGMRVSVGQIDTSALLATMTALRSEAQSVRDRIVCGSIPHERLSDLIDEIERNVRLLGGSGAAIAPTRPNEGRSPANRFGWTAASAAWAPAFT